MMPSSNSAFPTSKAPGPQSPVKTVNDPPPLAGRFPEASRATPALGTQDRRQGQQEDGQRFSGILSTSESERRAHFTLSLGYKRTLKTQTWNVRGHMAPGPPNF